MNPFITFIDNLKQWGLEYFGLYYGTYKAFVDEVDDSDRGRIKVIVPATGNSTTALKNWARPCQPLAGKGFGFYTLPAKGEAVFVQFEGGRIEAPIWIGGWYADGELPDAFKGKSEKAYGFVTRKGHQVTLDEDKDRIVISHTSDDGNSFVSITGGGEVVIQVKSGETLYLSNGAISMIDSNGNVVAMGADGIKLFDKKGDMVYLHNGGMSVVAQGDLSISAQGVVNIDAGKVNLTGSAEPMVKGRSLWTWLMGHTHGTTIPGLPTTPPIVPPPTTIMSTSCSLK